MRCIEAYDEPWAFLGRLPPFPVKRQVTVLRRCLMRSVTKQIRLTGMPEKLQGKAGLIKRKERCFKKLATCFHHPLRMRRGMAVCQLYF